MALAAGELPVPGARLVEEDGRPAARPRIGVGAATWPVSIDALARGGRLVICGATTGGSPPAGLHRIFWKQIAIHGSTMGSDSEFRAVWALAAARRIRPTIDVVYPLEQAAEAHARLEAVDPFGKVVLRVSDP